MARKKVSLIQTTKSKFRKSTHAQCMIQCSLILFRITAIQIMYNGKISVDIDRSLETLISVFMLLEIPSFPLHFAESIPDDTASVVLFKAGLNAESEDLMVVSFISFPYGWMTDSAFLAQLNQEMVIWIVNAITQYEGEIWGM
jgi:hypothetical protein